MRAPLYICRWVAGLLLINMVFLVDSFASSEPSQKSASAIQDNAAQVWIPDWKSAPTMSRKRTGHVALVINDRLHVIGGADEKNYLTVNEYARIAPDGSLSSWADGEHPLNVGRAFHGARRRLDRRLSRTRRQQHYRSDPT